MSLSALERLRLFLRPPGRGIYTRSTGGGYAASLLQALYGSSSSDQVQSAWEDSLQRIRRVDVILLGIPSDTGAGILRGANFGPIGIREAYLARFGGYPKDVLDVGDIICVPQLLHDEMLSPNQVEATRRELYPGVDEPLPVSPLSIAEKVYGTLFELNSHARIIMMGGDHSVSWPAMLYCHQRCGSDFGVLHFDAHTDLLEQRLGVKYCYTTWAFHALGLLKPQHLVQVGIRTSMKPKEHWVSHYPVQQFWASEVIHRENEVIDKIAEHFTKIGVKQLYISNDIDGTDSPSAPATGTPEEGGLSPEFVKGLIRRLGTHFSVIGGDVVEVAPPLSGLKNFASEKTCVLAAQYLKEIIESSID